MLGITFITDRVRLTSACTMIFLWEGARGVILRIYTGHDGQTRFEDLPLPAEESHNIALQAGANLTFRCFPADYWSDWHTAPPRRYIYTVAGS